MPVQFPFHVIPARRVQGLCWRSFKARTRNVKDTDFVTFDSEPEFADSQTALLQLAQVCGQISQPGTDAGPTGAKPLLSLKCNYIHADNSGAVLTAYDTWRRLDYQRWCKERG